MDYAKEYFKEDVNKYIKRKKYLRNYYWYKVKHNNPTDEKTPYTKTDKEIVLDFK